MLARIADLTWRRPKLVLGLVVAFVAVAGAFGHNVETHLKAAGFTDSASESERATKQLREELGYDPGPGIVLLIRPRDGGRLDLGDSAVRAEVARLSGELARHEARRPRGQPARTSSAARALSSRATAARWRYRRICRRRTSRTRAAPPPTTPSGASRRSCSTSA